MAAVTEKRQIYIYTCGLLRWDKLSVGGVYCFAISFMYGLSKRDGSDLGKPRYWHRSWKFEASDAVQREKVIQNKENHWTPCRWLKRFRNPYLGFHVLPDECTNSVLVME